jgi:heterodisulfide reductase subunit B
MPASARDKPPGPYLYFPGCALKGTGVAYEESLLTLFRLLELPLQELSDWSCCGATSYMSIDEQSACMLAARNLALARQTGSRDIIAPCSACYLALRKCNDYAQRYPGFREVVTGFLESGGLPLQPDVRVRHPLEILYTEVGVERLRARVTRPWPGGPVACYYGCQAVRPYAEVDRPHKPTRMDELLQAIGIPTVDYPLKTKCCGGSHTGTIHPVGMRLVTILLKEAARRGAQAMVTICPLCQFNLDVYQDEIRRETREPLDMPVFYLPQVIGWVLGADSRALGLQRGIAGRKLLQRWFAARTEAVPHV